MRKRLIVLIILLLSIIILSYCFGRNNEVPTTAGMDHITSLEAGDKKTSAPEQSIPVKDMEIQVSDEVRIKPDTEPRDLPSEKPEDAKAAVPKQGSLKPANNQNSIPAVDIELQPETPETNTSPEQIDAASLQNEMLEYINAERIRKNMQPLTLDKKLCEGSMLKSTDMGINDYFNHISPQYGNAFQMMSGLGISYKSAAENIARNTSMKKAHSAFMDSEGHRANILNPDYNKIGLGFYQKGNDLFVTQWFTD